VASGARLAIEFSDGRIGAVAEGQQAMPPAEPAPPFRRRRARRDGGEGQGSLF
jgi:hypothetical protein